MKLRIFTICKIIFLVLLVNSNSLQAVQDPQKNKNSVYCLHYWESGNFDLIPSQKTVGQDIGIPPSTQFKNYGTYKCSVYLDSIDVRSGRYIFIGEVGDASYLELKSVNGKPVKQHPIFHGLDSDLSGSVYSRYLPFVISTRSIYIENGTHEFIIRYKDLVPHQVGIRSGPPTIESFTGVIRRALICSPAFTFHIFQILLFLILATSFLSWPKLDWKKRILYFLSSISSAFVILQVSAIPRSFVSPLWAIRLNDFSQIISFPFLARSLVTFFSPKKIKYKKSILLYHSALCIISIPILLSIEHLDHLYMITWGLFLLFLGGLPCLIFGISIQKKWTLFSNGPELPKFCGLIFVMLGLLYAFDIVNLLVLDSRFYSFNHFLFFSTILCLIWRIQSMASPNEIKLRTELDHHNRKAYQIIASNNSQEVDLLSLFSKELAELLGSNRFSIQEIVEGKLRFLGHFGNYINTQGLHEIKTNSLITLAIETKTIQYGKSSSYTKSGETDIVVVPLENNKEIIGVLCATDFVDGSLPAFYRNHMETIKYECEPVLALLISERHNRAKDLLIQMMRNRTHSVQLKSEEHFLKYFSMSPRHQNHAFIYGDLVGSVVLNERYKDTNAIENAIDEHLQLVWEKFKHLGVVVSRTKGDMISFVVPTLVTDLTEKDCVDRCYRILQYISESDEDLLQISKQYGIAIPLQYRFAMSRIEKPIVFSEKDQSIKSFNLLVDEAIDSAARVISGCALDGECIVMEPAKNLLGERTELLELSPQRLKGKSFAIKLWALNKKVNDNAA